MFTRLLSWFIFSVVIGLTPIIYNIISLYYRGNNLDLSSIIGKGELFLFIAALSASSIGELMNGKSHNVTLRVVAGGAATIILFMSALVYSDIFSSTTLPSQLLGNPQTENLLETDRVVTTSLWFLLFSILTSASCIGVASYTSNYKTSVPSE